MYISGLDLLLMLLVYVSVYFIHYWGCYWTTLGLVEGTQLGPIGLYWISVVSGLLVIPGFLLAIYALTNPLLILGVFLMASIVSWGLYIREWLQRRSNRKVLIAECQKLGVPIPASNRPKAQFLFEDLFIALFLYAVLLAVIFPKTHSPQLLDEAVLLPVAYTLLSGSIGFWVAMDVVRRANLELDSGTRRWHFGLIFLSFLVALPLAWLGWRVQLRVLKNS